MISFKYLIVIFFLLFSTAAFSNVDEINKINQQIESIDGLFKSGAMDEDEYDKIKTRLLIKKKKLENSSDTNNKEDVELSVTLKKQIEVLEKLLKDGAISEEEFLKSKTFLEEKEATGQNIDLNELADEAKPAIDFVYNYKKNPGRKNWEKVVLEFKNHTSNSIKLYANSGAAQILFFSGDQPEVSYSDRKGKYQGQVGITLAKSK